MVKRLSNSSQTIVLNIAERWLSSRWAVVKTGKQLASVGKQLASSRLKYCQTMVKRLSNSSQTIVLNIAEQLLSDG